MLRLYRVPFSTNVERVSLVLGHKGLEAEWVDADPSDRSEVESVSGEPLVPVLVEDGRVVFDSTEIIRYIEEQAPVPPLRVARSEEDAADAGSTFHERG